MKSEKKRKKAVFLDRDGVVNPTVGVDQFGKTESPLRPKDFRLFPWTAKAVKKLNHLDLLVIFVSNQPAIAKGKMSHADLRGMHEILLRESRRNKWQINGIYYCLHHPDAKQVKITGLLADCNCRKPRPGMLFRAAEKFNIDLKKSWIIGDSWRDIEAGRTAGCKTILLPNKTDNPGKTINSHFTAANLLEAAEIISKEETLR